MVETIGMSFTFAWLRLGSGSIWSALLMHAIHKTFIQNILNVLIVYTGRIAYFTTEFGQGMAIVGVLVRLVLWRMEKNINLSNETASQVLSPEGKASETSSFWMKSSL